MTRRPSLGVNLIILIAAIVVPVFAADKPQSGQPATGGNPEINQLKLQLTEQQRQIDELRAALREQKELMEANRHPASDVPAAASSSAASAAGTASGSV